MPDAPDPPPPSRRTILRVGGTAAWTAPVIVAATATSAFAGTGAAGDPMFLVTTTAEVANGRLKHRGWLENTGNGAGLGKLALFVQFEEGATANGTGSDPGDVPVEPIWAYRGGDGSDFVNLIMNWDLTRNLDPGETVTIPPVDFILRGGHVSGKTTTSFSSDTAPTSVAVAQFAGE